MKRWPLEAGFASGIAVDVPGTGVLKRLKIDGGDRRDGGRAGWVAAARSGAALAAGDCVSSGVSSGG